jgi:hypothetical protein
LFHAETKAEGVESVICFWLREPFREDILENNDLQDAIPIATRNILLGEEIVTDGFTCVIAVAGTGRPSLFKA